MSNADILIHIDENLNDHDIHQLERELAYEQGVKSACVNEKTRHLMVVDFDTDSIHPVNLLGYVQNRGLHAQLIGL